MSGPTPDLPRHHARQRTLKSARIVFNNSASSMDVLIRDMSEGGAKLKLGTPGWPAPDLFDLVILNPNTGTRVRHPCEKRWQRGDLVGARFLTQEEHETPAPEAAAEPLRNATLR